MSEEEKDTTPETEARKPGRPRKNRETETEPQSPKATIRQRAAALLSRSSGSRNIDSEDLRQQAEARQALLVSRLEAAGEYRTKYTPEMVRQFRFELQHLQNGTWFPGIKAPKGAAANLADNIIGGPKLERPQSTDSDRHLDAILEESK